MRRLINAFRGFFSILLHGQVPPDLAGRAPAPPPASSPPPAANPAVGALQVISILQRDARLIDFLMEDISSYSDDQVGAAVRSLHEQSRQALGRYLTLEPVIDGVEGSFVRTAALGSQPAVKYLGNVPAQGTPAGGLLRHRGWRAAKVQLPPVDARQDQSVICPAEIEVE